MGLAKLDDAEFARRARERNNRVNAAHRQRQLMAGLAQTNVWLPAELRQQLDRLASERQQSLSVVMTALLSAALAGSTAPANHPATPAINPVSRHQDLFESSPTDTKGSTAATSPPVSVDSAALAGSTTPADERNRRILELHSNGLSGHAIGRELGCSEATVRRVLKKEATPA